jgi:hypothetical protein
MNKYISPRTPTGKYQINRLLLLIKKLKFTKTIGSRLMWRKEICSSQIYRTELKLYWGLRSTLLMGRGQESGTICLRRNLRTFLKNRSISSVTQKIELI